MKLHVGDRAKTISQLRPTGRIVLHGKPIEARSETGFVDRDCEVVIVRIESFGLIVRKYEKGDPPLSDSGAVIEVPEPERDDLSESEPPAPVETEDSKRKDRWIQYTLGAIFGTTVGLVICLQFPQLGLVRSIALVIWFASGFAGMCRLFFLIPTLPESARYHLALGVISGALVVPIGGLEVALKVAAFVTFFFWSTWWLAIFLHGGDTEPK